MDGDQRDNAPTTSKACRTVQPDRTGATTAIFETPIVSGLRFSARDSVDLGVASTPIAERSNGDQLFGAVNNCSATNRPTADTIG